MSPRFIIGLTLSLSLFLCNTVFAANRVIILENPHRPVAGEIARELETYGFSTQIISDTPTVDLAGIASRESASATIRLNLKGRKVEVWVADRITGKLVMRTIELTPGDQKEQSIIVLAAVELLRASLMEIYAVQKQPGKVQPTKQTRSFAKPVAVEPGDRKSQKQQRIISGVLSVGVGGNIPGKQTGLGGHGRADIVLDFDRRVQFSAVGRFPLAPFSLSSDAGQADLNPFLFGAQTTVLLRPEESRLRLFTGMGMGVMIYMAEGAYDPEYIKKHAGSLQSRTQTVISTATFFTGGVLVKLNRQLALRLSSILGISTMMVRTKIGKKTVARLGQPFFYFDAGLDLTLW
ncbi:MAG: hypothetical protein JXX14_12145 [Deltaproteobacteria bacterium]|nr:hypothetical protein [Deltaproteobacteria bacterium]